MHHAASRCVLDIRRDGATLLHDACGALGSKGNSDGVFNSLPWERHEVIQIQDGAGKPSLGMSYIYTIYVVAFQTTIAYLMLCVLLFCSSGESSQSRLVSCQTLTACSSSLCHWPSMDSM